MTESPLLTSAKNNPLARGGWKPLDGGHDNVCPLVLATTQCLASSRLEWTHHFLDFMAGGRSCSLAAVTWSDTDSLDTEKEARCLDSFALQTTCVVSPTLTPNYVCLWGSWWICGLVFLLNLWTTACVAVWLGMFMCMLLHDYAYSRDNAAILFVRPQWLWNCSTMPLYHCQPEVM